MTIMDPTLPLWIFYSWSSLIPSIKLSTSRWGEVRFEKLSESHRLNVWPEHWQRHLSIVRCRWLDCSPVSLAFRCYELSPSVADCKMRTLAGQFMFPFLRFRLVCDRTFVNLRKSWSAIISPDFHSDSDCGLSCRSTPVLGLMGFDLYNFLLPQETLVRTNTCFALWSSVARLFTVIIRKKKNFLKFIFLIRTLRKSWQNCSW